MIGVTNGATVSEQLTPNFTVQVEGPGACYDKQARRVAWSSDQDVDCSVDENGNPTAVVGAGNSKYLSIFAHFDRTLSDPRTDGFGTTIFFNEAETFELRVVQGAEAVSPSRPPLDANDILLADILIAFGQTTIQDTDIDDSRTEFAYDLSGSPLEIRARGLSDVLQQMLDSINSFTSSITGDLADQTSPDDGATLIGIDAISGTYLSTIQGTLKAMLVDLIGKLNTVSGTDGARRIGYSPHAGGGTGGFDVPSATSVGAELDTLISQLNAFSGTDGAARIGFDAASVGDFSLPQGSIRGAITALLTQLDDATGVSGAARVGIEAYAGGLYGLGFSGVDVRNAIESIIDELDVNSGTCGAQRVGSKAAGWLSAGNVYLQLDAIQGAAMRRLVTNDVYDDSSYAGPALLAQHASDDVLYCLAQWGSGGANFGLWCNVNTGGFAIVKNLTRQGSTGPNFMHSTTGEAYAFVCHELTTQGISIYKWDSAVAGTNVGDLFNSAGTLGDGALWLQAPSGSAVDGATLQLSRAGLRGDGQQICHWSVGTHAGAGSEDLFGCVNFKVYYTSTPTSFSYITSSSANVSGSPVANQITNHGCNISGFQSVTSGAAWAYGTITVSP